MKDQPAGSSSSEANLQRLRDEWKLELEETIAVLRDEFEARLQTASQSTNAGWFVRRIEALERENLALRLERDRALAETGSYTPNAQEAEELRRLKAENEALERDLRQAQAKLDGFRQLLNGEADAHGQSHSENLVKPQKTATEEPEELPVSRALVESPASRTADHTAHPTQEMSETVSDSQSASHNPATVQPKPREFKAGRAFQRAEAIFLAIKDWNRLHPLETFVTNPGVLETVFHVHRQAAKDFFNAYQNELWEYHQEINVESPRWHNRGKDMEKLKAFVEEKLGHE